jgi:enoyl-CoA hydratase
MSEQADTEQGTGDTPEPQYVGYEVRDSVAWVTLARPQYSNAQNYRLLNQLDDRFRQAVEDDAVKVIVLGGEGKHFSSGHDIGSPERDREMPRTRRTLWYDHVGKPGAEMQYVLEQDVYLGFCRRWQEMSKPSIAMVQGACVAGGLMLAWACDMIVASDDAFFQDPVMHMGVPGVEYFAHAFELPPRIAREFLLLGQRMPVERAYQYGMVNRVVPRAELRQTVEQIAADVAKRSRFALALAKQALNFVEDLRGKRVAMDGVFHMHHLAHAHNQLVSGNLVNNLDVKEMAQANRASGER